MRESQRERVKEALLQLDSMPFSMRQQWIAEELADDPDVRAEVESLLSFGSADPGGVVNPLDGEGIRFHRATGVHHWIGPYRLIKRLGQGGTGEVHLASQVEPLQRQVAIKVLRSLDHPDQLVRLNDEAAAIARLSHPNVAQLYESGVDPDVGAYLVLEYVDGPRLTEYCRVHEPDVRERLQLILDIARGVEHAHRRGILHRDLKPSNVLVSTLDGRATPKIIDFGLARDFLPESERSPRTLSGQILGTVGYMSPEQATPFGSDVDTRTDVYSLGVLLYELLTGRRPIESEAFEGKTAAQVHQALLTARVERPSRISELPFAGELDFIPLRALEPAPDQRYSTAGEMADDIERYLVGDPLAARPPSTVYLVRKWAVRNRALAAACLVAAVGLLVGAASLVFGLRSVREQRDLARAERSGAIEVAASLGRVLTQLSPQAMGPDAFLGEATEVEAERFLNELPDSSLVRGRVAAAYLAPMVLRNRLGLADRLAPVALENLVEDESEEGRQLYHASLVLTSVIDDRRGGEPRYPDSLARSEVLAREHLGATEVMRTQMRMADRLRQATRYRESDELRIKALANARASGEEIDGSDLVQALADITQGRMIAGDYEAALESASEALGEIRSLGLETHPGRSQIARDLSTALMRLGRLDEAAEALENQVAWAVRIHGASSLEAFATRMSRLKLANAMEEDGVADRMREAIENAEQAGLPDAIVSSQIVLLLQALLREERQNEAASVRADYLEKLNLLPKPSSRDLKSWLAVGEVLHQAGEQELSKETLAGALEFAKRIESPDPSLARMMEQMARRAGLVE